MQFHPIETEISLSWKFWKKCDYSATCWAIPFKSRWRPVYGRIILNIKFHEILCFSSWATLAIFFLSQTDRHFPVTVKSWSGHPKMCKSIKNRKSKVFLKKIACSKNLFFCLFFLTMLQNLRWMDGWMRWVKRWTSYAQSFWRRIILKTSFWK